jgi:hypothetical protein
MGYKEVNSSAPATATPSSTPRCRPAPEHTQKAAKLRAGRA